MKSGYHARIAFSLLRSFCVMIVAALCFIGFILQFVGVADKSQDCYDAVLDPSFCSDQLLFIWWSIYFEISTVSIIGILAGFQTLSETRLAVLTFLAIATVEMIHGAERFIGAEISPSEKAAVVGFVFSVLGNFILILMIGVPLESTPRIVKKIESKPSTPAVVFEETQQPNLPKQEEVETPVAPSFISKQTETPTDQTEEVRDQTVALEDQIEATRDQTVALEDQIEATRDQTVALEDQIEATRDQTVTLEDQIEATGDQVEALEDQIEATGDQTVALEDQIEATRDQTVALEDQIEATGDQVEAPLDQTVATRDQTMALEDQKKDARYRRGFSQNEIEESTD
eukprot:g2627.t1